MIFQFFVNCWQFFPSVLFPDVCWFVSGWGCLVHCMVPWVQMYVACCCVVYLYGKGYTRVFTSIMGISYILLSSGRTKYWFLKDFVLDLLIFDCFNCFLKDFVLNLLIFDFFTYTMRYSRSQQRIPWAPMGLKYRVAHMKKPKYCLSLSWSNAFWTFITV